MGEIESMTVITDFITRAEIDSSIDTTPKSSTEKREPVSESNYCSECVGWGGSIMILTAYIGTFSNKIELCLNIVGAIGLLVICWKKKAYQPIFLNTAWIVGSIYNFES